MTADSKLGLGTKRRAMLIVAVLCQLATVAITWSLWQIRDHPVNLPVRSDLPQVSFGWAMVASLVLAGLVPKVGVPLHWIVLITACTVDQFRLEPQFFGLAVLMLVYFGDTGLRVSRWYLVAMWVWAGIHKFLSPEWMGHLSWSLVDSAGLPADRLYLAFAVTVAATELTLGLLAWYRPRFAAWLCVVVHVGVVIFLSPLVTAMNYSVIPWNLGIACVGYWILMQFDQSQPQHIWMLPRWEKATVASLMLVPIGFYFGWVDRCFCHVMYSGSLPRGLVTSRSGTAEIDTYPELAVPFPHERRLYRLHFARTAQTGDKLHIADPRRMVPDLYFRMQSTGPGSISSEDFFSVQRVDAEIDEVFGVGIDDKCSLFALSQAGVRMLRKTDQSMVYAVAFTSENFDRKLLAYLKGLPNLQQIQFSGTDIRDEDLAELKTLRLLTGLGLNHTPVTDQGLSQLDDLPHLQYVESDGTAITKYRQER